tara:strand:+ start:474 stop:1475 length:1002 start_codon:yes stop_codon:yes gene_type:complete
MIVKYFELKKNNLDKFNFFLLYGNNKGLIIDTLEKNIKSLKSGNIFNYDENEIIKDEEIFEENINNKSFFDDKKLIIISRATDKIIKIIEGVLEKNIDDVTIVLMSGPLEKKSKLRIFFEKSKKTICIPFYEDNLQSLNLLASNFFKEKKILISQQNINLLLQRCRGDRINLYNELQKIENFTKNKKKIETSDILKLTNLSQNFEFSELVDSTLAKDEKKTFNILNENNFAQEDSILIIRIFLSKLKKLLKIRTQIEFENNIDNVITNFKPPIFWKDKDIVKKQIKILNHEKIKKLIFEINNIELMVKKHPSISTQLITNFVVEQATGANNEA